MKRSTSLKGLWIGVLAVVATALVPAAHAQNTELVYEFSVLSGVGGVPDFGRPFWAAASPDGRHLYVATQFPDQLVTFARNGMGLDLVEMRASGEGGVEFPLPSDATMTSDGELVVLSSFIGGNVVVFRRDADTGLLTPVQEITVDGMDNVDGVDAHEDLLMWGVGPGGNLLVRFPRAGSKGVARLAKQAVAFDAFESTLMLVERPDEAVVSPVGWAAWNVDRVWIGDRFTRRCTVTLDSLAPVIGPDVQITKVNAYFSEDSALLNIFLDDGSIAEVLVDGRDCTVSVPVLHPQSDDQFLELTPAIDAILARQAVDDEGNTTVESFDLWVTRREPSPGSTADTALHGRGVRTSFGGEPITLGSRDSYVLPPVIPPEDAQMGRPIDLPTTHLNSDPSGDTRSAHAYAISPNPPGIHAFRLTTEDSGCTPSPTRLCLNNARFAVEATYTTPQGDSGTAMAMPMTPDSGYFYFFDDDNVEVLVKALDGCGVNQSFWVFAAGLTNVEVQLAVTDTETGQERLYTNPQGEPFLPIQDTGAFVGCGSQLKTWSPLPTIEERAFTPWSAWTPTPGWAPATPKLASCTPDEQALCLADSRFRVTATWQTPDGRTGTAMASTLTGDTGTFWFFDQANVEVVVKVLQACGVNQRHWVFAGGLTDVRVDLTVEDTASGEIRTYTNPLGQAFQPIQDTGAFATCP